MPSSRGGSHDGSSSDTASMPQRSKDTGMPSLNGNDMSMYSNTEMPPLSGLEYGSTSGIPDPTDVELASRTADSQQRGGCMPERMMPGLTDDLEHMCLSMPELSQGSQSQGQ